MPYPDTDDEIELSRQERLRDLGGSVRAARPGAQVLQEAIRTASALMKSLDDGLAGNPAVVTDPDLYRLAYRAFENLYELHRAMGGVQPTAGPGRDEGPGPRVVRPRPRGR
ncbi:MAG: hypothetical protein ABWY78_16205 [Microvirga sp.]